MTKVALIFGGEPRFVERGYNENKIFLQWLNDNYDVDVHVHSWDHTRVWSKEDHDNKRFNGRMTGGSGYYLEGTSKTLTNLNHEDVKKEFSVYNPKTIEVERYNTELLSGDGVPKGQYLSRAKAYKNAMEYSNYDFVWLTRTDVIYDANQPSTFTYLEDLNNKILCQQVALRNEVTFTAEDWFYAGAANNFSNLTLFATDPLSYIRDTEFGGQWFKDLRESGQARNSHIWQALITGGSGEGQFIDDGVEWKLLYDE